MISGKTKYYAIIGTPIEQALSPIVHNAAFKEQGIDAVFLGCDVKKEELKEAVSGVRALGFSGLVVTMPHKVEIIPYLDEVADPVLGAVNTVVNRGGRLIGYNTDGDGYVDYVRSQGVVLEGKNVLMFGAGGAGRSVALALLRSGIQKLYLCNLPEKRVTDLMNMLEQAGFRNFDYVPFEGESVGKIAPKCPFITNTTSLGMNGMPSPHVDFLPWEQLDPKTVFMDIVHKPLVTPMLQKAGEYGFPVLTGDGMLLYQGLIAYQLFTGRKAPGEAMKIQLEGWLNQER